MSEYGAEFFEKLVAGGGKKSAEKVVPLIVDLLKPTSVIDIGCGTGAWLSVFLNYGVEVLGVDGEYVKPSYLEIPTTSFVGADLSKPFFAGKTFDLVVSLEVAEHLDPDFADQLVDNLVTHGPAILFSAAIPLQTGVHHVNEQWPSYWAQKFEKRGYLCVDWIRPQIWSWPEVDWWYAQNMLLYLREQELNRPHLSDLKQSVTQCPMSIVHPRLYLERLTCEPLTGRQLLGMLIQRLREKFSRHNPTDHSSA